MAIGQSMALQMAIRMKDEASKTLDKVEGKLAQLARFWTCSWCGNVYHDDVTKCTSCGGARDINA